MGYGFYGHGSWVVVAFLVAAVLARSLRGRGRGSRRAPGAWRPGPYSSGFDSSAQRSDPTGRTGGGDMGTHQGLSPGWFPDPSGRHEERYWSGSEWTEHVMSNGVPGVSAPPGRAQRAEPAQGADIGPDHDARADDSPPTDGDAPGPGPR